MTKDPSLAIAEKAHMGFARQASYLAKASVKLKSLMFSLRLVAVDRAKLLEFTGDFLLRPFILDMYTFYIDLLL
jgi:hypothetical protein